jgi:DNA mismatch repair protein MutL
MACRSAAKAGDELSDEYLKQIIRFVAQATFAFSCPHGRPTMISLSLSELEKLFARKV